MHRIFYMIISAFLFLLVFHVFPVSGQEEPKPKEWTGLSSDGKLITKDMLKTILSDHKKWSNLKTDLSDHKKWLDNDVGKRADLSGAELIGADLGGARLSGANLSGALLLGADLNGADLGGADLSGASLVLADLSGARLYDTDLSGAHLLRANLSGAYLLETNLSRANVYQCNFTQTNFQLKPNSLPYIPWIASAVGLSQLTYDSSVHSLVELREAFKEAGLRKQEREITYAIKRTQRQKLWNDGSSSLLTKIESLFQLIFFEWTCAYGMKPGQCLLILIALIFFFTIPYAIALSAKGKDGIWVVWISDRVRKDLGSKKPVRLYKSGISTIWWGVYFSILSAFSIGWREINVGNWISRIKPQEYTLRATGWVRVVSGLQSLTSVYLLALWVLTYFGRPFEAV